MARVPVSRDRVHPREWGRRAALGVALLPIVTCLAFASNASPGTDLSERVPAATAYALPAVSSAQRHHLGLDGVWELSSAKEAVYAGAGRSSGARMTPGAPELRSSGVAPSAVAGSSDDPADDARWWDGFGLPGLSSIVHSLVEFDGTLIAGGEFTFASGQAVAHVARWTGAGWAPMGDGLDGPVYALAVYDGHLIAGGEFVHSGTVSTGPLAQWDGQRWQGLAAGSYGCVHALAPHGASLAAGGCFWIGSDIQNVGLWNGHDWSRLGDGVDGHVFALTVYRDELIAGGGFAASGTVSANRIARWTGESWQPMGDGVEGGDQGPSVKTLLVVGDALIAGGWFTLAGGTPAGSIARWDGAQWSAIPGAPGGDYDALLVDGDGFLAAGFLHADNGYPISLARWGAQAWSEAAEPLWGVRALARHEGTLFAGGYFQQDMPPDYFLARPLPWICRLDGARWAELESPGSGMNGLTTGGAAVFRTFHGQFVAGGAFDNAASPSGWVGARGLARWDGSRWQRMADLYGQVSAMVEYEGALVVAGYFVIRDGDGAANLVRWDGAHWSDMSAGHWIARSLAVYRGELYASGAFTPYGDNFQEGVFRWNGSSWVPVGAAFDWVPYGTWVSSLHVHGDLLVAGGRFQGVTGLASPNLVAWDGTAWRSLGTPFDQEVRSLATYGDRLYAGGTGAYSLAWWAGEDWHQIATGSCGVSAMEVVDGSLYVGGLFGSIAGVPAQNIARWDGTTWQALGSGTNGEVRGIGVNGRDLYAGGWFSAAGDKPSFGIARWSLGPATARPPFATATAFEVHVGPNPARAEATISYRLTEAGDASITVHDLSGRVVATLVKQSMTAGEHQWTWRPSSGQLNPGLYLVRVSSRGKTATTKMAWTP